jgi:hypothetical protein
MALGSGKKYLVGLVQFPIEMIDVEKQNFTRVLL